MPDTITTTVAEAEPFFHAQSAFRPGRYYYGPSLIDDIEMLAPDYYQIQYHTNAAGSYSAGVWDYDDSTITETNGAYQITLRPWQTLEQYQTIPIPSWSGIGESK